MVGSGGLLTENAQLWCPDVSDYELGRLSFAAVPLIEFASTQWWLIEVPQGCFPGQCTQRGPCAEAA